MCFRGVLLGETIINILSRSCFVDKMTVCLHFHPQPFNIKSWLFVHMWGNKQSILLPLFEKGSHTWYFDTSTNLGWPPVYLMYCELESYLLLTFSNLHCIVLFIGLLVSYDVGHYSPTYSEVPCIFAKHHIHSQLKEVKTFFINNTKHDFGGMARLMNSSFYNNFD